MEDWKMSNDLISRKAVMKFLSEKNKNGMPDNARDRAVYCFIENLIDEIRDGIPTAYDVDKVVERLELLSENEEYDDLNTYEEKAVYNTAYLKAIEIVKAGGIDG